MTDFEDAVSQIKEFNNARGWLPRPHDIAKSIVIEAAELLELFQWDVTKGKNLKDISDKDREEVEFELADIFWYIINFCQVTGISLPEAVAKKRKHLEEKYPVEEMKGELGSQNYYKRKQEYRAKRK